jgi:hypothetical protein
MLLHLSFAACRRLGLVFVACTLATFAINQASSQLPPFSELFPERDKLSELLPLAEKGDARAQFQLGTKYLRGRGIAKNPAEALRWLRASGEQGFAKAQLYLGNHYTDVAKDDSTALVWFRRAADNLTEREGVRGAFLGRRDTFSRSKDGERSGHLFPAGCRAR